ncbi:1043_t:CDS:2, partial [Gigaspora margarita]
NEYNEKKQVLNATLAVNLAILKKLQAGDNKNLLFSSLEGVEFRPFVFRIEKYLVQVINIGIENNSDLMVELNDLYQAAIYQFNQDPILILDTNPNNIWKNVGLFKKLHGIQLFGLENSLIQKKIAAQKIPNCTPIL